MVKSKVKTLDQVKGLFHGHGIQNNIKELNKSAKDTKFVTKNHSSKKSAEAWVTIIVDLGIGKPNTLYHKFVDWCNKIKSEGHGSKALDILVTNLVTMKAVLTAMTFPETKEDEIDSGRPAAVDREIANYMKATLAPLFALVAKEIEKLKKGMDEVMKSLAKDNPMYADGQQLMTWTDLFVEIGCKPT